MELLLAGAGMLACLLLMMVVIPLGVRLLGWVRSGRSGETREAEAQEER